MLSENRGGVRCRNRVRPSAIMRNAPWTRPKSRPFIEAVFRARRARGGQGVPVDPGLPAEAEMSKVRRSGSTVG